MTFYLGMKDDQEMSSDAYGNRRRGMIAESSSLLLQMDAGAHYPGISDFRCLGPDVEGTGKTTTTRSSSIGSNWLLGRRQVCLLGTVWGVVPTDISTAARRRVHLSRVIGAVRIP